jgi:putative FmdB family regulatory protein
MPTYEYKCSACDHAFERFQKISDRPVRTCPECGKRRVRRLISSGGGLLFKGPGFYATDYRSDAGGPKGGPKTESGSGESASSAKEGGEAKRKSKGGDA